MGDVGRQYDPALVGRLLARSGDHRVYRYGSDAVIKFSQFDWSRSVKDLHQFYSLEVAALERIFGQFYLKPEIVWTEHPNRPALVQPFVVGEPLAQKHLADSQLVEQFHRIVAALRAHQSPGEYIDLVGGGKNFFVASFGNILVTEDRKLWIIDSSILRAADFVWWIRPAVTFVIWLGNRLQTRRIRNGWIPE